MKVFQINTFCGIKSTGRIATDIAHLVERDGGQCKIAYGAGHVPEREECFAIRIGTAFERKVHAVLRKLLDAEGYGSHGATRKLIREIKAFAPDVIHLHNVHGCIINLPMLFRFLRTCSIPVVWTLHDCWSFTGHCAYFEYADCQKWKDGCHHCPQQRNYPVCIGLDGSARNYRLKKELFSALPNVTLVTPCEWLADYLPFSFLQKHPVRVIPNGVDRQTFHPVDGAFLRAQYGIEEKYVVVAVGSDWDERKGLRYLLQAAEILGEEYRVVVIGLTAEQVTDLPQGVLGIEHTSNTNELVAWYSLADCFANPTMEDNMPMVNLEALACGTSVAVFQTGGCVEAVNETCGATVPKGDATALADAIRSLTPQKAALRDACLAQAKHFDKNECFEQYLELYKELAR